MSMCYWMIEGIGIDTNELIPFIDKRKLVDCLSMLIPDDKLVSDIVSQNDYDKLNLDDFLYGEPFCNLGDLLTYFDDTHTLTHDSDGGDRDFLYYPPSMPWERLDNEPKSIEEVHKRIITAVSAITTLSSEEIDKMIDDDLYVVGCG